VSVPERQAVSYNPFWFGTRPHDSGRMTVAQKDALPSGTEILLEGLPRERRLNRAAGKDITLEAAVPGGRSGFLSVKFIPNRLVQLSYLRVNAEVSW
jgi:hypothetical protein